MSETMTFKIKVNFQMIFVIVLIAHAFLMIWSRSAHQELHSDIDAAEAHNKNRALQVQSFRTVGAKNGDKNLSTYLSKSDRSSKQIMKDRYSPIKNKSDSNVNRAPSPSSPERIAQPSQPMQPPHKLNHPLSLKDFAEKPLKPQEVKKALALTQRPGTRPVMTTGPERPKAMEAIKLNGAKMSQFSAGSDAAAISGDPRAATLSNSDIMVKLEVPEGVSEEDLNQYELMFYGFQRRTAIGYINSFYKNLDKFERENPHKQFPLTEDKQTMTGRLTFDANGNLKQIKMVRWTNVTRLQDFFVDVLKDMDTLHNPPKQLWERDKEFTVFFSLIING